MKKVKGSEYILKALDIIIYIYQRIMIGNYAENYIDGSYNLSAILKLIQLIINK
jgi:hypothetical protein